MTDPAVWSEEWRPECRVPPATALPEGLRRRQHRPRGFTARGGREHDRSPHAVHNRARFALRVGRQGVEAALPRLRAGRTTSHRNHVPAKLKQRRVTNAGHCAVLLPCRSRSHRRGDHAVPRRRRRTRRCRTLERPQRVRRCPRRARVGSLRSLRRPALGWCAALLLGARESLSRDRRRARRRAIRGPRRVRSTGHRRGSMIPHARGPPRNEKDRGATRSFRH